MSDFEERSIENGVGQVADPVVAVKAAPKATKKRKRRTPAQMEADKKRSEAMSAQPAEEPVSSIITEDQVSQAETKVILADSGIISYGGQRPGSYREQDLIDYLNYVSKTVGYKFKLDENGVHYFNKNTNCDMFTTKRQPLNLIKVAINNTFKIQMGFAPDSAEEAIEFKKRFKREAPSALDVLGADYREESVGVTGDGGLRIG